MAAFYTFEDHSGASDPTAIKTDNPYQDLIQACQNQPISARYESHRTNRNAQQKQKLLAPDFPGVTVDEILAKLENPTDYPGFEDPRHCLVFWARPTEAVKQIIEACQREIKRIVPDIWLMPPSSLHMTALEITHSLPAAEIQPLVANLLPSAQSICDYTASHPTRLLRPSISFDAQAIALSWLPDPGSASSPGGESDGGDGGGYTYHHLRRDLFNLASDAGVKVASRYVISSAHLTLARFVDRRHFERSGSELGMGEAVVDATRVRELVDGLEGLNAWLEREVWTKEEGEWIVGEEKGLEMRKGALWYGGGGETVVLGKGI